MTCGIHEADPLGKLDSTARMRDPSTGDALRLPCGCGRLLPPQDWPERKLSIRRRTPEACYHLVTRGQDEKAERIGAESPSSAASPLKWEAR